MGADFEEGPDVAAARAERREKNKLDALAAPKEVDLGAGVKAHHGKFVMVGEAAGDGMAEGMDKSQGHVKAAAAGMADAAPAAAKKKLDAHSPSVVFEDIGGMAAAGFAMGLSGSEDVVGAAVSRMLSVPRGAAAGAAGARSGDVSLSIGHIIVHVGGRATEEDGAAAARGFAQELRPQLVDLLEQVRAEMGV
jgi:hypothetical protein